MGEIANMMINGLMCEQCCVYMDDGEEPGYPRLCAGCRDKDNEITCPCGCGGSEGNCFEDNPPIRTVVEF